MNKSWHVEHGDGSRWTPDELAEAYHCYEAWFVLSEPGFLGVLYRTDDCFQVLDDVVAYDWNTPAVNVRDMRVVWDG